MKCTWFQGIWWIRKAFDEGDRLAVHGTVEKYGRWFSMTHPDFDHLNDEGAILDTGRIVPLYPGGEGMSNVGLTSRSVRRAPGPNCGPTGTRSSTGSGCRNGRRGRRVRQHVRR